MKKRLKVANPLNTNMGADNDPNDLIENIEPPDADVYGGLDLPVTGNVVARPVSLFDISPNPTQPRRVLPSHLRFLWRTSTPIDEIVFNWHRFAEEAFGDEINVIELLDKRGVVTEEEQRTNGVYGDFLEMVQLAGDIRRDGLLNPITIIGFNAPYKIETGERRWWAYHILRIYTGESQWNSIPATITDKPSVWRMAGENQSRQNLNAIAKARQLALIIMELNDGRQYLPYDAFEHDREYYAQVANGNDHRIPDDKLKAVCEATGLSSKAQVSQYRRLLRELTNELWDKFDADNTPERVIRMMVSDIQDDKRLTTVNLKTAYMEQFWSFYDKMAKKHTQIAGRVGEAERRQMADALRKLADDLERTKK